MYCKHCGKHIADDSTYCQFCGGKLDNVEIKKNKSINNGEQVLDQIKNIEPQISNEKTKTLKDDSLIVREIKENLKMIGYASILFLIYMFGFILIRSREAKPLTESGYWGESCYDPESVRRADMFSWEQHYALSVLSAPDYSEIKESDSDIEVSIKLANSMQSNMENYSSNYLYIMQCNAEQALNFVKGIEEKKQLPQSLLDKYIEEAKVEADKAKQDFRDYISSIRRNAYEDDLKENAKYAAIISLLIMIVGRYLFKLIETEL